VELAEAVAESGGRTDGAEEGRAGESGTDEALEGGEAEEHLAQEVVAEGEYGGRSRLMGALFPRRGHGERTVAAAVHRGGLLVSAAREDYLWRDEVCRGRNLQKRKQTKTTDIVVHLQPTVAAAVHGKGKVGVSAAPGEDNFICAILAGNNISPLSFLFKLLASKSKLYQVKLTSQTICLQSVSIQEIVSSGNTICFLT
jgi:hypothetical protein